MILPASAWVVAAAVTGALSRQKPMSTSDPLLAWYIHSKISSLDLDWLLSFGSRRAALMATWSELVPER